MIRRAPSNLVRQMRVLIAEEAFLGDLTTQVTDYYGGGRKVVHGPWQAGDCQRVLLRWFDSGLIDCIAIAWATAKGSREVINYEYDASWRSRATDGRVPGLGPRRCPRALERPGYLGPGGRRRRGHVVRVGCGGRTVVR